MKLTLHVTTQDNDYNVTTSFFNIIEWERKTKRQASDLSKGIGYEDLAYLAYAASKTAGIIVPAVFDDFMKKIVDLEVVSDEPSNPTQPEAGVSD